MKVWTASWFTPLPPEILRVGISRSVPKGQRSGFKTLRVLAPGPWCWTTEPAVYHRKYAEQLAKLSAQKIADWLHEVGAGYSGVALLCYEDPKKAGSWCHRAIAAQWLRTECGLQIDEIGFEGQPHPLLWEGVRQPDLFGG